MTTPGSKRPYDDDGALWVHGLPARSYEQVADYLNGDAHFLQLAGDEAPKVGVNRYC